MNAVNEIGYLLINTFFYLAIVVVMLRLILQLVKADFYNPVSQSLVKLTQPVLKPLRRVIPGFMGIDFASVALALVLQIIAIVLLLLIAGVKIIPLFYLIAWAIIGCLYIVTNIYFFGILIYIVLSWVAPGSYNPAVLLIHQIIEPVMAPFRKVIPPLGGLDLSPIIVFLALNIIQIVLRSMGAAVGLMPHFVIGI